MNHLASRSGDAAAPGIDLAGQAVLVTGASGFLGSHLTRRLLHEGAYVHAMARRSGGSRLADVRDLITEYEADVTDVAPVLSCFRRARPEVVVHLAADTASRRFSGDDWAIVRRSIDVNLVGTLNVLRAALECASVRRFVRAGGLEEYGNGDAPYREPQREQPVSPYSASQVATTHYCQVLQRHTDAAVVTLRPALVYGPHQATDYFIPGVILACLGGQDVAMSSGNQRRDLLYVDDVVDAFVRAASHDGLHGAIVNVGHGEAPLMSAVAEEIVSLIGGPAQARLGAVPDRAHEIVHLLADTDTARRMLDWKPEIGLREGLQRTITWYRDFAPGLIS